MIRYNKKIYYSPQEIVKKFSNITLIEIYKAISTNKVIYIGGNILSYLTKKDLSSDYYIREENIIKYLLRR